MPLTSSVSLGSRSRGGKFVTGDAVGPLEVLDDDFLLLDIATEVRHFLFEFLSLRTLRTEFGKVRPTLFDGVLDTLLDEL